MKHFVTPKPIPLILFLGAFGVCVALGTWQIERLQWKRGLIEEIADAKAQSPLRQMPRTVEESLEKNFYPVLLQGRWVDGIEFHLAPRYFKGRFGYTVIAPLKLADGTTALINRGWVPADKKLLETRPETRVRGQARIEGLIRYGAERSPWTPKNQPEKNVWFGRDIDEMAAHAGLSNVTPAMVDLVGTQDAKKLPVPSDGTITLRNDHLSYIFTWYGIALGILVIFLLYHRKK
jgi:surfeit locus 1 family protein